MVRGRGYAKTPEDIGGIVLLANGTGTSVKVQDVGEVALGPDLRRGVADWNGKAIPWLESSSCGRARMR